MCAENAVQEIDRDFIRSARRIAIIKNRMDRAQDIANAAKKAAEKASKKAMEKGMAKGMAKEKLEIARKMKELGLPFVQIANVTGLSLDAIETL